MQLALETLEKWNTDESIYKLEMRFFMKNLKFEQIIFENFSPSCID
jgi:hypothetical protein